MPRDTVWSTDVRVSMPLPPGVKTGVPMQGFAFTENGLAHDIDESQFIEISTPDFQPDRVPSNEVYDDLDVDGPFAYEETF